MAFPTVLRCYVGGRRAVFIGEVIVVCLGTEEMVVDGVEEGGKNLGGTYIL